MDVQGGDLGCCLGCQKGDSLTDSITVSLKRAIHPLDEGPPPFKSVSCGFVVIVSMTDPFFSGQVLSAVTKPLILEEM